MQNTTELLQTCSKTEQNFTALYTIVHKYKTFSRPYNIVHKPTNLKTTLNNFLATRNTKTKQNSTHPYNTPENSTTCRTH